MTGMPQLPGHRDLAPLGRGGYSEVYRAYQEQFDRWVAVKILTFTLTDERSQRRFLRECRLAGRLSSHPNIVTVYDAGISPDGRPYISMELFPEGSITDVLQSRGPFDPADALRIGIALAGALETAHRAGVVHRDVKPGNVLLASYGQPVLTDFGLSIVAEHHEVSVASDALTPYHAAPEVLERTSVTPTSDVYSLASTVYAVLAGRAAHQSDGHDSIASLLLRILQQDVPPLSRPGLPPSLAGSLQLAMSRDPSVRTPTATTFAQALQDAQRELGVEVTEPVVMDIPASSADIAADPPGASPSPAGTSSPGDGSPGAPGSPDPASTSGPWMPAPAPLWDPTSAASPLPSSTTTPESPAASPPAPPVPAASAAPGAAAAPPAPVDLSAPSPTPPSAGSADVTVQRARLGTQPATETKPASSTDGSTSWAPYSGSSPASFSQPGPGVGEHTVHRDQVRPAPAPAPLSPPAEEKSRWSLFVGVLLLLMVCAAVGSALFFGGDDDGGGRGDREPSDDPATDIQPPTGLAPVESPAGVQLDWEGQDDVDYVVLILSEVASPTPQDVTGTSVLIPTTALDPEAGYCFAVARTADLGATETSADAFSPPRCIRGASEDSVRLE